MKFLVSVLSEPQIGPANVQNHDDCESDNAREKPHNRRQSAWRSLFCPKREDRKTGVERQSSGEKAMNQSSLFRSSMRQRKIGGMRLELRLQRLMQRSPCVPGAAVVQVLFLCLERRGLFIQCFGTRVRLLLKLGTRLSDFAFKLRPFFIEPLIQSPTISVRIFN